MCFLRFLMQARSTLGRHISDNTVAGSTLPKLHLVVGNESCDLDSAVSALTLAFIYAQRRPHNDYVPILNIPRLDYPLKTEVVHMLSKCDIDQKVLLFKDDLPQQLPSDIGVILVDHHVSPLIANVVQIFDHRPVEDANLKLVPKDCEHHIEADVGSCSTLVAEEFFAIEEQAHRSQVVARLLHATIVLDTINFSPTANRFCNKDLSTVERLEQLLKDSKEHTPPRHELFDELVAARADISRLTLVEVLRKDMKELETAQHKVPMAGLPMLVRDFIDKSDAEQAIREFAGDGSLLVILGMYVTSSGSVQRDVALISPTGQTQLLEHIRRALFDCQEPRLELTPHDQDSNFMGGYFMRQHNVKATRKHILPIVRSALLDWEKSNSLQDCDCIDVYFFKEKPKLSLS